MWNINSKVIEAGKSVLMKYTLPDALKPQYDGMTAYELAKMVLEAGEQEYLNQYDEGMAKEHEEHDCSLREKGFCKCVEGLPEAV